MEDAGEEREQLKNAWERTQLMSNWKLEERVNPLFGGMVGPHRYLRRTRYTL